MDDSSRGFDSGPPPAQRAPDDGTGTRRFDSSAVRDRPLPAAKRDVPPTPAPAPPGRRSRKR